MVAVGLAAFVTGVALATAAAARADFTFPPQRIAVASPATTATTRMPFERRLVGAASGEPTENRSAGEVAKHDQGNERGKNPRVGKRAHRMGLASGLRR
jgi:hypothetical protein